jgi:hypothetical protein
MSKNQAYYVISAVDNSGQRLGYIKLSFSLFDAVGKMELVNLDEAFHYPIKPGVDIASVTSRLSAKISTCIPYFNTEQVTFHVEEIVTSPVATLDYKEAE